MQADLTADTSVLDRIRRQVDEIQMPDTMRKVEEMAVGVMSENILGSHAPDGSAYRPLARPRPPGRNQGVRPLIDTGELFQSLIEGPDHIADIDGDSVRSGTRNWKAGIHQDGTGRIPARPMVGVNEKMADQAATIVSTDLFNTLG